MACAPVGGGDAFHAAVVWTSARRRGACTIRKDPHILGRGVRQSVTARWADGAVMLQPRRGARPQLVGDPHLNVTLVLCVMPLEARPAVSLATSTFFKPFVSRPSAPSSILSSPTFNLGIQPASAICAARPPPWTFCALFLIISLWPGGRATDDVNRDASQWADAPGSQHEAR